MQISQYIIFKILKDTQNWRLQVICRLVALFIAIQESISFSHLYNLNQSYLKIVSVRNFERWKLNFVAGRSKYLFVLNIETTLRKMIYLMMLLFLCGNINSAGRPMH